MSYTPPLNPIVLIKEALLSKEGKYQFVIFSCQLNMQNQVMQPILLAVAKSSTKWLDFI